MLIALKDGKRTLPSKTGERAECPECGNPVLSKCGQINIWHWAHVSTVDCDSWGEPESAWHLKWKKQVPTNWIEVVIEKQGVRHRADIQLSTGHVIELQHSAISVDEISARESFYGKMLWIFDVSEAVKEGRLDLRVKEGAKKNYRTFRWKHAKKHIAFTTKLTLLDLGDGTLLHLGKMFPKSPVGGYGFLYRKQGFIRAFLKAAKKQAKP